MLVHLCGQMRYKIGAQYDDDGLRISTVRVTLHFYAQEGSERKKIVY